MAGLKMFQSTQTSFVDGRTSLVKVKRNEAVVAFIYNYFVDKALLPLDSPRLYVISQMLADLQAAEKLAVATIFGTASRFQFAVPKCRLSRDADPDLGNETSPADYMRFGWTTIAQRVNQMLALGAKIVFAIYGTSTRCSFMIWCGSQPASVVCHGSATSSPAGSILLRPAALFDADNF